MKVKVIKRYVDKNSKQMMEVGMTKDYPKERAIELIKSGRVEEVKEAKTTKLTEE